MSQQIEISEHLIPEGLSKLRPKFNPEEKEIFSKRLLEILEEE